MKKAAQSQRFKEAARELGADQSGEVFERAFKRIVPPKRGTVPTKKDKRKER